MLYQRNCYIKCHINSKNTSNKSNKKKQLVVDIPDIKVIWVYSATNILLKYN